MLTMAVIIRFQTEILGQWSIPFKVAPTVKGGLVIWVSIHSVECETYEV